MTPESYLELRRRIKDRYLNDLAALERVWAIAHPDTPIIFESEVPDDLAESETLDDLALEEPYERPSAPAVMSSPHGEPSETVSRKGTQRRGPVDIKCPHCGSEVYRKGTSPSGKNRYRCRGSRVHTFIEDAVANCGCGRPGNHKGVCAFRRGASTQADAVLKALEDGPGTSHEIAERTGIDYKAVSAVFSVLESAGKVETIGSSPRKGQKEYIRALIRPSPEGEQESHDLEGAAEPEEVQAPAAHSIEAPARSGMPQASAPAALPPAVQRHEEIKAYRQRARGIADAPQPGERHTEPARNESAVESSTTPAAKPLRVKPEPQKASCGICVWRELPPERKGEKPKRMLAAQAHCPKHGSLMEESVHTAKQGQSLGN